MQRQILVNVKQIPVQVPIYEEQEVQDGTRTVEVTRVERKRIQAAMEAEWVLEPIPADDWLAAADEQEGGHEPEATQNNEPVDAWQLWAANYQAMVMAQSGDDGAPWPRSGWLLPQRRSNYP